MSQENVEIVRASIEAYRRADYLAATAYLAPDVWWESGQEMPAQSPAEVRRMWKRWTSDWEELDMLDEEFIDAGDNVVVVMRYRGLGRLSGVSVERLEFEVHTFRDGQCVRKANFETRTEALETVGLSA